MIAQAHKAGRKAGANARGKHAMKKSVFRVLVPARCDGGLVLGLWSAEHIRGGLPQEARALRPFTTLVGWPIAKLND